jgi:uncharacterized membrane protein
MLIDIGWLLIAAAIQHYAVGRRMSDRARARKSMSAAFISWAVFRLLARAVGTSGGTVSEALAAGAAFGAVALAVVIVVQLRRLTRAKHQERGTD